MPELSSLESHRRIARVGFETNGIAFSTLYDHLYRSRYWAGIPVGCSDFRVPLWKVRVLVICPHDLVGIHLACTVVSGDIFRSVTTCIS